MVGAGLDVGALVAPVGADPQLSLFVHRVGTDLHFQHLALRADDRRVQRAVTVLLGVGDVVVELFRNVPPQGVDDPQRGVAVAHFRDQHAHRAHIVDLAELQALALHFAPDRIDVFGPAADVGVDAGGLQFVLQLVHHIGDEALTIEAPLVQQLGDLLVLLRLQVTEGQVLQLPLDMADTKAMSQRCVDVEDFPGDPVALLVVGVFHRANRAGPLGQLDQCHTHVIDHRHQHLAQVFHLGLGAEHEGLAGAEAGADRRHAQHAVDQLGHHRAEALADGRQRDLAFTDATVEYRGHQRILIQLEVGKDLRDLEAGAETRHVFATEILRGDVLLLCLTSELAGFFQGFTVQCHVDADRMIEPRLEIDTAVGVDRLVRSHLYHLALPSLRRTFNASNR